MKMSEKRRTALYRAIFAPLTDLRIKIQLHNGPMKRELIDRELIDVDNIIWQQVCSALNLEGPA